MAKKSETRRKSILDAALKEFESKGFAGALVEDVAREAGISKGTIYSYFESKDAILMGLAEEVVELVLNQFVASLENADDPIDERIWRIAAGESGPLEDNGHGRVARILRIVWSEGLHRPDLMNPFFEKFVMPLFAKESPLRAELERSNAHPFVKRYPMAIIAPVLQGVLWASFADRVMPLDLKAYFRGYLDMVFQRGDDAEKPKTAKAAKSKKLGKRAKAEKAEKPAKDEKLPALSVKIKSSEKASKKKKAAK